MGADPRFFERLGPLTASELATRIGAAVKAGGAVTVCDVAEPAAAVEGELCFLSKEPGPEGFTSQGGVVIAPSQEAAEQIVGAKALLIAANPKAAFSRAASLLVGPRRHAGSALIDPSAVIAPDAVIGPGAVIGPDAQIGAGAQIGPGSVIGPGVEIGAHSRVGARASIQCAVVAERCEIYAGAIIGEAGFGLAPDGEDLISIPHLGRVIIESDVTIGANSTVDRGMLGDTRIGANCRIDNLCHIAHNVQLGAFTIMAAFAGISGSVKVGAGAKFGGRVGVADHLEIGEGSRLAADAAVMRNVPAGEMWAGSPAQPIQRFMREVAWLRQASGAKKKRTRGTT